MREPHEQTPDPAAHVPKETGPRAHALRFVGLALIVVGLGIRFFVDIEDDTVIRLVGWTMLGLGACFTAFGDSRGDEGIVPVGSGSAKQTEEPAVETGPPLKVLGYGSLGIAVIGLGWIASDVFSGVRAGNAWYVVLAGAVGLLATAFWSGFASPMPKPLRVKPPEDARRRMLILGGIIALLLVEAAIPQRYYQSEDPYDERFAWRMFSDIRVYRCDIRAFDLNDGATSQVRLMETVHVAWVNTLRRNREGVMQRYLTWRCENAEVDGARVVNACVSPEGEAVPDVVREIDCASGEISRGGDP